MRAISLTMFRKTSASQVLSKYDLFAVQPTTENLFKQACTSLEVDIIALDLTGGCLYLFHFYHVC